MDTPQTRLLGVTDTGILSPAASALHILVWKYIILGLMEDTRPPAASIWKSALRRYCERALAIQHIARMRVQAAEGRGDDLGPRDLEQYTKWLHPAGWIDRMGNIVWSARAQQELRDRDLKAYIQRSRDPPPEEPPPKTEITRINFVSAGFQVN